MRKLSELEGVCLGIVNKVQPCTVYRVRQLLKQSPSSHWRASAGSVYPLLTRLEEAGLVSTKLSESDGRGRKPITITRRGRQALKEWITAGADIKTIRAIMDPIRSRTFFLDVLTEAQQLDYLKQLVALTDSYLTETKTRLENTSEKDDFFGYLGAQGAMLATEAKLEWLKIVQAKLRV